MPKLRQLLKEAVVPLSVASAGDGAGDHGNPHRRFSHSGGAVRGRSPDRDLAAARAAGSQHRHRDDHRGYAQAFSLSLADRPRLSRQSPEGARGASAARHRDGRSPRPADGGRTKDALLEGYDRQSQGAARHQLHEQSRNRRQQAIRLSQRFRSGAGSRRRRDRVGHLRHGALDPARGEAARRQHDVELCARPPRQGRHPNPWGPARDGLARTPRRADDALPHVPGASGAGVAGRLDQRQVRADRRGREPDRPPPHALFFGLQRQRGQPAGHRNPCQRGGAASGAQPAARSWHRGSR